MKDKDFLNNETILMNLNKIGEQENIVKSLININKDKNV